MQKIQCPKCSKSFIWTDNMPLKGNCPTGDCSWQYDVHEEIKKGLERRVPPLEKVLLCPNCQETITSRLTICHNCGHVVFGYKSYQKKNVFIFAAIVLIIVSLITRYIFFLK